MKNFIKNNWFRLVATAILFLFHALIYWILPAIIKIETRPMPDWMLTVFDKAPVIPFFIVFYFGCVIWWLITFETATKKRVYQIAFVAIFGYIIIAACFYFLPYTMIRTDDQITGNGLFAWMMRMLRVMDEPGKIFPSIHVFVSALAYLSVAFDKDKKLWVRITGFILLLLVWASTLFLKQHNFVDGLVAIIMAVFLLLIVRKTKLADWLYNLDEKYTQKALEKHNK